MPSKIAFDPMGAVPQSSISSPSLPDPVILKTIGQAGFVRLSDDCQLINEWPFLDKNGLPKRDSMAIPCSLVGSELFLQKRLNIPAGTNWKLVHIDVTLIGNPKMVRLSFGHKGEPLSSFQIMHIYGGIICFPAFPEGRRALLFGRNYIISKFIEAAQQAAINEVPRMVMRTLMLELDHVIAVSENNRSMYDLEIATHLPSLLTPLILARVMERVPANADKKKAFQEKKAIQEIITYHINMYFPEIIQIFCDIPELYCTNVSRAIEDGQRIINTIINATIDDLAHQQLGETNPKATPADFK
jgi:hypothetical protein